MASSCGGCLRWRRRLPGPKAGWRWSGFGFCRQPAELKPAPYWAGAHPSGDLMLHQTHGADCAAFKPRKR